MPKKSPRLGVREHILVPPREGRGVKLTAGERFRCVNVEGGQCGDLWAFNADDVSEYHSAHHTRANVERLFPRIGQQFWSNRRRPILTYVEDTSPGIHDMLMAACDPPRFVQLGAKGWHASCQENLEKVMASFSFDEVVVPQPINVFTHFPVADDLIIKLLPCPAGPGEYIGFRTEMDCVVVLSVCPQDILTFNIAGGKDITPLAIEVLA